jgi:hypothetical protein
MTAVLSAVSVADRVAMIEEHLEALASVPDVELTSGSAFDATASVLRVRRRVEALAARTSAAYATSGDWGLDGARSAKALLVGRKVESFGVVGRLLRAGAFMAAHPGYASAAMAGVCTLDHLIAVDTAYANYPRLRGALDAAESHILSWAATSAPAHFKALVADLCHRLDPDAVDEADAKKRREIFLDAVTTFEGYVNVSGFLDPETGQQLIAMLESARRAVPAEDDPDAPLDPRSAQRRNVEALHRILSTAAARTGVDDMPTVTGARPVIQVTISLDDLLDDAHPAMGWLTRFGYPTTTITRSVTQNLACDASLAPFLVDRTGQIVAALPKVRTIPAHMRTAIMTRDKHCRFPGCDARIDEVHHIQFHSKGGLTKRGNLVGLCYYHHQVIHQNVWHVTGHPDDELVFTNTQYPTRRHTSFPRPTRIARE